MFSKKFSGISAVVAAFIGTISFVSCTTDPSLEATSASKDSWEKGEVVYTGYTFYGLSPEDGEDLVGIRVGDKLYYINFEKADANSIFTTGDILDVKYDPTNITGGSPRFKIKEPKLSSTSCSEICIDDTAKCCTLVNEYMEYYNGETRWHYKYFCDLLYDGVIYTYCIPASLHHTLPNDQPVYYKAGKINGYSVQFISKREAD